MKREKQIGTKVSHKRKGLLVCWSGPKQGVVIAWQELAVKLGHNPTLLARTILEEWMACFLSEEELKKVSLEHHVYGTGSHLKMALAKLNERAAEHRHEHHA